VATIDISIESDIRALASIFDDPAFAEINTHPYFGAFGRAYYPAVYGNHDCSFAVHAGDVPVLVCLCAPLDGKLGFYGMPLRLIARRWLDDDTRRIAIESGILHIDALMQAHRLQETVVLDQYEGGSVVSEICRKHGATMSQRPVAQVDLLAGLAAWRAALRKSSRSLINWGRRNLTISCVNKETPDRALFDRYRAFHAEVAGRVTRSEASWTVMYDWIAQGGGELIVGFLDGRMVAGSMFVDGAEISNYASGVYDRALFDKPLAHYPIWLGIEHAHARGMKMLEVGPTPARGTVPDKDYKIGYFKRGFATHIVEHAVWRWLS